MKNLNEATLKEVSKEEKMLSDYTKKAENLIKITNQAFKNVSALMGKANCTNEIKQLIRESIQPYIDLINSHRSLQLELYNDLIHYSMGVEYYQNEYRIVKKERDIFERENAIFKSIISTNQATKGATEQPFTPNLHLKIVR